MLLFFLIVSKAKVARFLPVGKCNLRGGLYNFNYHLSNKWLKIIPRMDLLVNFAEMQIRWKHGTRFLSDAGHPTTFG